MNDDRLRFAPLVALVALAIITVFLPAEWLWPLNLVGYAVCHRIPERSFFAAQTQLPVCARDTGMFSGALIGLVSFALVLRTRASLFPARPYIIVLAVCFLAWGIDGFNSYVVLATGNTLFYPPQNWLRLVTGALMGVSLSAFVAALMNQAIWRDPADAPTVGSWRDVARLLLIALGIIVIVLWRPDFLYGPIALTSSLGAVTLLTIVNGLLVLIMMRRHGQIERWSQLILPMIAGLCLSIIQIGLIDLLRASLSQSLGLPY
jgi:uncharacterized membrane protein